MLCWSVEERLSNCSGLAHVPCPDTVQRACCAVVALSARVFSVHVSALPKGFGVLVQGVNAKDTNLRNELSSFNY